jgi:glycosyltransferase involved in cell wall biosynthesis
MGPDAVEVVVADNISTDRTGDIARERGCVVARVERRAIASARNGGAKAATGRILAFVDADQRIHPETFNAIREAMTNDRYIAGASGVRLERWSLGIALTFASMLPMVWLTGMDTGVVFYRREDYLAVGGYNEGRLYAEDVQLLMGLRRIGKGRGQKLVRLKNAKALNSMRKFDQFGDWHHIRALLAAPFWFAFSRAKLDGFVRNYWYENQDR